MKRFRRLCIYCGSSRGFDPTFAQEAAVLGRELAARDIGLVYGGGHVGLMGVVADAALAAGGEVIGVIPRALQDMELGHHGLAQLHVVGSMHERKQLMADLADGFIALPGGIGTLDELFEAFTWLQLGFHPKPVALLNTAGFYDALLQFVRQLATTGFLRPEHERCLLVEKDIPALLSLMESFQPPAMTKWLDKPQPEER